MPARGRVHFHSGAPKGDGWERAPDLAHNPDYGKPLPAWDPKCPPPLDPTSVPVSAKALREDPDPDAWYGRPKPGATPYTYDEYAERYHKPRTAPMPNINWPPNDGAVPRTKLEYKDASKFIGDFGDKMDRLGQPGGKFMGVVEDPIPPSYEARAIHYGSLYNDLLTYRLIPGNFPDKYKICVMETAPALGQPGGSVGLIFLDDKDNQIPVERLTDRRTGALRGDG